MSASNVLVYLLHRDLRVSDNPILHCLAKSTDHGFTHLLPVFVFPAHQIEVSGFIKDGSKSPYPEARGEVGGFWRCGPFRAKFIAQSVWNLKESLDGLDSGLTIRVGKPADVLKGMIGGLCDKGYTVGAVWMMSEEGVEEKRDEKAVSSVCSNAGVEFKVWNDEKYFIDDRDLELDSAQDLPDIFTTYRKTVEPLAERPRPVLPKPPNSTLPKSLSESDVPAQGAPFEIPSEYDELESALLCPVKDFISNPPSFPENMVSAHPFKGGETEALHRLHHIVASGAVYAYKNTRNGLIGTDFSTKLSAYLSQGCITARQIHEALTAYEDGKNDEYADAEGYGKGENDGTKAVRFELLWRDYMRLCAKKFTYKLFRRSGFRDDSSPKWKTSNPEDVQEDQSQSADDVDKILKRIFAGTTGMGLIDASQRELIHTGYTSNRARQNVASFIAKHLGIDWRFGAEWYEMLLVDYDVCSNWANWQYVSGVGNDPRGEARIFNPVKQAFDYDKEGEYVRGWVPEVRKLEKLENVFQAWTTPKEDWDRFGLTGLSMAEEPIKKIDFSVDGKPKNAKRPFDRRRKNGMIRSGTNVTTMLNTTTNTLHVNDDMAKSTNGQQHSPQQYSQFSAPESPRGASRGGRGNGGGGYRGRGYGRSRGGYRAGRSQYQGQHDYAVQRPISMPWTPTQPGT
ncbi:DASH family cryptochrome [Pseudomassariella vexata]|uniref:Cryptochrome DASH n=1 Tax=Pseudomassariella vexata TaxID=1141098 RepID=A0A1Y2E6Y7_9PEZI|nr:DASH family cryptochrome [Pseudomassariella vexata]ORY67320.1 DASH family cryptochrome [Pseudomassariella vexata]